VSLSLLPAAEPRPLEAILAAFGEAGGRGALRPRYSNKSLTNLVR
jgi:hypothetical protein